MLVKNAQRSIKARIDFYPSFVLGRSPCGAGQKAQETLVSIPPKNSKLGLSPTHAQVNFSIFQNPTPSRVSPFFPPLLYALLFPPRFLYRSLYTSPIVKKILLYSKFGIMIKKSLFFSKQKISILNAFLKNRTQPSPGNSDTPSMHVPQCFRVESYFLRNYRL